MIQEDELFTFSSSQTLSNDSVRPALNLIIPPFPLSDDSDLSPLPTHDQSRNQSFNQTFNQTFNHQQLCHPTQSPTPANPFWLPNVKAPGLSATQPSAGIPSLEDEYGNSMMEQTLNHPLNMSNSQFLSRSLSRSQQFHRSFGASWDNIPVERAPMDWSMATSSQDDSEPSSYYTSGYTSSVTSPRSTSTASLAVTPSHSASSAGFSPYSPSTTGARRATVGSHVRTPSPYDLSYTTIITQVRRRHGASCHLCKTTMPLEQLFVCAAKAKAGERKRRCRKKFCGSCLMRCHDLDMASLSEADRNRWICVSCSMLCQCAACQRRPNCEAMSQSIKQAMSQSQQMLSLPIISSQSASQPARATLARATPAPGTPFAFPMEMFRVKQEAPAQSTPVFQFPHAPHCARFKR